ncbi:MAG: DKNYY domain-containing protein [Candidatus Peribacteria bacterium]|nr:DKNYY domain-containing protein [Candidatus Peribacteria bacterium]
MIDYDKKNIGLTTLQSSQKFANSKGKLPASVTNLFDKILITEEDIVKYPDLSTGTLYYQPIKEADFDTFMIIDGSRSNYAIDKNNVYAIPYEIDKVITSSGESLKYYQLFPSANRKFFIPFN